jgi:type IV pilus assembly protein PilP
MRQSFIIRSAIAILLTSCLSACGDSGVSEVKLWMAQTKAQAKVTVPKLSEPKKFIPFTYADQDAIDPFNQSKLTVALAKSLLANAKRSPLAPDPNRRHEPLESYPLDAITMVGAINKGGPHAILQADKTVFDVKVGDYLGQNDGKIEAITDSDIKINERVQDASGEWVERKTTLELQETKK